MPLLQQAFANEIERRQLTFKEVEILCEIDLNTIMYVLAGKTPKEEIILKICDGLHLDRDDITTDSLNISIKEAAEMTGKSADYIRMAIEQKRMPGSVVFSEGGIRSFHIPRKAFENYMGLNESFSLNILVSLLADEVMKRMNPIQKKRP